MTEERPTCAGFRDDGQACTSPFVVKGTRYCSAHQPGGREEMRKRGRLGALIQQAGRGTGLDEDELPPLETHEDGKAWLEIVGRAVACGRMREAAGQCVIRAVEGWLKAEGERLTAVVVEDLKREVDRLKEELGNPKAMKAWS